MTLSTHLITKVRQQWATLLLGMGDRQSSRPSDLEYVFIAKNSSALMSLMTSKL